MPQLTRQAIAERRFPVALIHIHRESSPALDIAARFYILTLLSVGWRRFFLASS